MSVFLDACAIIYLIEAKEPFHSQVIAALRAAHERHPDARLGVSRLSVLECLVKPLRDGDQRLTADYRDFFASHDLTLVEIGPTVIWNLPVDRFVNLGFRLLLRSAPISSAPISVASDSVL